MTAREVDQDRRAVYLHQTHSGLQLRTAIYCILYSIATPRFEDLVQMTILELNSNHLSRSMIGMIRIEKAFYQELLSCSSVVWEVGQIYQKGFDLVREDGRLMHFRGETWLHSPFGAVLDQPIPKWVEDVSLREGDIFERKGRLLQRRTRNGCSIQLNPSFIVDLKRTLRFRPPQRETLLSEIQLLSEEIFKWNRFEGMAGVLALLAEELPSLPFISLIPISFWSSHALPRVRKLVSSVIHEDLDDFGLAWEALLGLGPGLTPAGDDFLVGFLAAHKLFSSSFGERLRDNRVKIRLEERARIKTVPTSSQFLKCALDGIFSEILYLAFDDLRSGAEDGGREKIEYFLKWGHSSGADTLTGVVFGLWSMIPPGDDLKPVMKVIPRGQRRGSSMLSTHEKRH